MWVCVFSISFLPVVCGGCVHCVGRALHPSAATAKAAAAAGVSILQVLLLFSHRITFATVAPLLLLAHVYLREKEEVRI